MVNGILNPDNIVLKPIGEPPMRTIPLDCEGCSRFNGIDEVKTVSRLCVSGYIDATLKINNIYYACVRRHNLSRYNLSYGGVPPHEHEPNAQDIQKPGAIPR